MTDWLAGVTALEPRRVRLSGRTLREALETALMKFTRAELEIVLAEELQIPWTHSDDSPKDQSYTKRGLIQAYTPEWTIPKLVGLARRVISDYDPYTDDLALLVAEYDRTGGVGSPAKNLIFAANGPKPELVLRDSVSNDIEIVKNAQYCLIFDQPIPADGLTFQRLINWWRERESLVDETDREVALALRRRLLESIGSNGAEHLLFEVYNRRYKTYGFDIPALIPQVYLHYDPYTLRERGPQGSPLERQRMDFLLLFSERHRVVLEVDGIQHYADTDGKASTTLYSEMVAEDRRLRLDGYEVYRFGGKELTYPDAETMLERFFDDLQSHMR